MKLVGAGEQQVQHYFYDASGTITAGGSSQIALPVSYSRSYLKIFNTSASNLTFDIGCARATAALTNGAVSAVTVTNAGQGFSQAPIVEFLGGGNMGNTTYVGSGQPGAPGPSNPAQAHCVMSGTAPNMTISSIVIDNPGSGYVIAPYVFIRNSRNDPNGGLAVTATSGVVLTPNGSETFNGTGCPTEAVSIYGGTTGLTFTLKWMT